MSNKGRECFGIILKPFTYFGSSESDRESKTGMLVYFRDLQHPSSWITTFKIEEEDILDEEEEEDSSELVLKVNFGTDEVNETEDGDGHPGDRETKFSFVPCLKA